MPRSGKRREKRTAAAPPAPKSASAPRRERGEGAFLMWGLCAAVALLVVGVHWPVLSAQALSIDDNQYLTDNPLVQDPGWTSAGRFLGEVFEPSTVRGYYQPLAMISLMVDYALGGREGALFAFHRTSLLLHVASVVLIVWILYLLLRNAWVAGVVGLLFGVHPLTVEAIAWIGERKTMLAATFGLASVLLYVIYARRDGKQGGEQFGMRGRWLAFGGSLLAFVLALLSKPTSTPLPVALVLLDVWPLGRMGRRALLEKIPFFAIAGVSAVITLASQGSTSALRAPSARPMVDQVLTLLYNIAFYVRQFAWPWAVSGNYVRPRPFGLENPVVLLSVVGSVVLVVGLLLLWRRTKAPAVGWLVFFFLIFPTMGVIGFTNVVAADKFFYLPAIGFLLVMAWGLRSLWERSAGMRRARVWRLAVVGVPLVLAGCAAVGTRATLSAWQDSISLYRHMIDVDGNSATAHYNLGLLLMREQDYAAAEAHFAAAATLHGAHDRAEREWGLALERQGRDAEALPHYERAVEINPRYVPGLLSLAGALLETEDAEEALTYYRAAIELQPGRALLHHHLGIGLHKLGRYSEAVGAYREALRLNPRYARAYYNLGVSLLRLGRNAEAAEAFAGCVRLEPDHASAQQALELARRRAGGGG